MVRLRPGLAAILFLLCAAGAADAAGEVLTLEDALTQALTNNPSVQNAGI